MTAPPAGWYADPQGMPVIRWWDGNTWTEHTQAPMPPQMPMPHPYLMQTGSPGGAYARSILTVIGILAVISIVFWLVTS